MELKCVSFNRKNTDKTDMLKEWWKNKSEKPLTDTVMTDFGFMAYQGNDPVVSIFLYPVNGSEMAMIGFPISNPKVEKKDRREVLSFLIKEVEDFAYHNNYNFVMSWAGSPGAVELFSRENYFVADQNVTQFVKRLS